MFVEGSWGVCRGFMGCLWEVCGWFMRVLGGFRSVFEGLWRFFGGFFRVFFGCVHARLRVKKKWN